MKSALALLLLVTTAHADPFASPRAGVADLVWVATAACDKGDDTQQRQCRQIRDRKAHACVDCDGIELDGKRWHVVGTGARIDGGKLRGAILHDTSKVFADEAAATAWSKPIKTIRVEYVIKLPAKPRTTVGGKDAVQLDIAGWRVIDACTGAILASKPESAAVGPDKQSCK
jgi:hypothetical protein